MIYRENAKPPEAPKPTANPPFESLDTQDLALHVLFYGALVCWALLMAGCSAIAFLVALV